MSGVGKAVSIEKVLVSEEIRQIRRDRWSGVLAMTQGDVAKGLYFLEGDIAFAASTVEEDRLGANLYRIGRITESEFRAAMEAVKTPGRRLGQALMDAGVLSPVELAAAVTGQVERIVLSVLRWTGGRHQRRSMDRPLPADLVLDLNTPRLLLLGARTFPDARRLEALLGAPTDRLRLAPHPPFDYEEEDPSPVERALLERCADGATLETVLGLPHPRPQLLRAAYALVAGAILEPAGRGPDTTARAGTVPPGGLDRSIPSPSSLASALVADASAYQMPDEFEPALPVGHPGPQDGERRARALLDNGQREAAVALLREVLERHPQDRGCRRLLAMTLAQSGGYDRAVERLLLAALEAEPDDVELRYRLATYYRRGGIRARAMLQLRLVLSADPSHAGAWRDLGELEAGEGGPRR